MLDNIMVLSIIIFTPIAIGDRVSDAAERSQTRSLTATREFESKTPLGHRRALCQGRLFRCQRPRPGQVRDASPGAGPRGLDLYKRESSKRSVHSNCRTGALDSRTVRHNSSSTKYRAQFTAPSKKTSLNEGSSERAAGRDLVTHYEQLRREATTPSPRRCEGLGLALFLRRGMTAWMQAWSQCVDHATPNAPSQPAIPATIPIDVRAQIAALLAGIIIDLQQEATP